MICKNSSYYFWGETTDPMDKLKLECKKSPGKLPVWRVSNITFDPTKDNSIPCVPKNCSTADDFILHSIEDNKNATTAEISCKNTSHHFWGSKILPTQTLTLKCLRQPAKHPEWVLDIGIPDEDSKDIACYDGGLCLLAPPDFNNRILLSDYDGKVHYKQSRNFSFTCPSNETGKKLILKMMKQCNW